MTISQDYTQVDPATVTIKRDDRQRKKIDTSGLKESIQRLGVLHPVIVTRDMVLVSGERRLTSCLELGIQVPIRYLDSLTPMEAQIIELEENLKRSDLPWQDIVSAMGKLHDLYMQSEPEWNQDKTAEAIGIEKSTISIYLRVYSELDSPKVYESSGMRAAYNMLARVDNRKEAAVMSDLLEMTGDLFEDLGKPESPREEAIAQPEPEPEPESILNESFLDWVQTYSGRRFNLVHCDFPYGINVFAGKQMRDTQSGLYDDSPDVYWNLTNCLLDNLDKVMSHSAHLVFWFSMKYYQSTYDLLSKKLTVNPYPFIWMKSDGLGVAPDPQRGPRQIYETAFLAYRGDRPIVKVVANAYAGPSDKALHPSTKPEPMLKHLFGMLVDGTSSLFDPTCGSGSSLRAAEALGAEKVLGLDIDPEHVENAAAALRQSRVLRNLSK
jgi:hypothetical protein